MGQWAYHRFCEELTVGVIAVKVLVVYGGMSAQTVKRDAK